MNTGFWPVHVHGRLPADRGRKGHLTGCRRAAGSAAGRLGSALLLIMVVAAGRGAAQEEPGAAGGEAGVFLPADRVRERQFSQATDLVAAGRWSDAAALFDELLGAERDAFLRGRDDDATRRSLKAATWQALKDQPAPGREAYELLFGARAQRALEEALERYDAAGVVAVARRWFHTPAGRRAALLSAFTALEADQPAVAASWLELLAATASAAEFEPTLSLMRSVALARSGDPAAARELLARPRGPARIGGRELPAVMSAADAAGWLEQMERGGGPAASQAEWCQPRGVPGRNPLATASRPLLVPRYRVPLTRHPEEARLLERQRRSLADAGLPPMPAGAALAIDGLLVVRTGLGILAVDFKSGKRLWLQASGADLGGLPADQASDGSAGENAVQAALARVFDDATSAGLSAADGLVFAVDSPAEAFAAVGAPEFGGLAGNGFQVRGRSRWQGGNRLVAYDLAARGRPRWRLPASDGGPRSAISTAWYLGAPLVVGHDLFVLVEEKGEIRLDVLDPATGTARWSQPLAELDTEQVITSPLSRNRRLAGLSPALADGVLVCPLGAGTVVAIDIATRTLLWAHRYPRSGPVSEVPAGMGGSGAPDRQPDVMAVDSLPLIAGGRVLFAPYDGAEVACLDLRKGSAAWRERVQGPAVVLGAAADAVVIVVRSAVEARSLEDGRLLWRVGFEDLGGRPSGRGILTASRLLLPCDTPEVVEIDLADGSIVARCPARGGAVPGNLVVYRGEIISRGVDSLDVFHQAADLETRIETVRATGASSPWVLEWEGQLDLERGDVAAGLEKLRAASRAVTSGLPPSTLAEAVVMGLRRDFAAAAASWRDALKVDLAGPGGPSAAARGAIRAAIDGFLLAGDTATAWAALEELLATSGDGRERALIRDSADPRVAVGEDRWIAGRLAQLAAADGGRLREAMAEASEKHVSAAVATADPRVRLGRLEELAERLASLPEGRLARQELVAALEKAGDAETLLARDVHRQILAVDGPAPPQARDGAAADAWPLGVVEPRRPAGERPAGAGASRRRMVPAAVMADLGAGPEEIRLAIDLADGRPAVFDSLGRHLLDLPVGTLPQLHNGAWLQAQGLEVSAFGRMLFLHAGGSVAAIDLVAARGAGRPLWTRTALPGEARPAAVLGWGRPAGRIARNAAVPLGRRINEPEGAPRSDVPLGGRATARGVLHHDGEALMLLDHVAGRVLWERLLPHGVSELVGDDRFVCACTPEGTGSTVLSMFDGRVVHAVDLPHRRQRLGSSGRAVFAVVQPQGDPAEGADGTVRIEAVDPVTLAREDFGEFSGRSRAVMDHGSRLLVLGPDGTLAALEHGRGTVFATPLPEMPGQLDYLQVVTGRDRHLVIAGRHEPTVLEPTMAGALLGGGDELTPPVSGAVWAVERTTGGLLWPAPVRIDRHAILLHQPADVPILALVRRHSDREPGRGELVCLDTRTGHALFHQEIGAGGAPGVLGLQLEGDPDAGAVNLLVPDGDAGRRIGLVFTGAPLPPQPPFRMPGRPGVEPHPGSASLRERPFPFNLPRP